MKYKQSEWMEIHGKTDEGHMSLHTVNFDIDWNVTGIEVSHSYSCTLSSSGTLSPKYVKGIDGQKRFMLEDDMSVSLLVDEDCGIPKFNIRFPSGIKNPKIIPFDKWKEDYFVNYNRRNKDIRDKIHSLKITGCSVNCNGFINHILSDEESEVSYGCFGRNVFKDQCIHIKDILIFTYGMCRSDICDEWVPSCCGTEYHAYFNENYDIVYDDDGLFYINKGYFS